MEKKFKSLTRITEAEAEKYISSKEDFKNNTLHFFTITPLEDGWEQVDYYTKRPKKPICFCKSWF